MKKEIEHQTYKEVTRYICDACGMEVAERRIHDQHHVYAAEIVEREGEPPVARMYERNMGHQFFGDESMTVRGTQLRSDGEWPL
jgi:hypothetical protein